MLGAKRHRLIYVDTLIVSPPRSCIIQEWSDGSGHHLLFWIHGCISMLVRTVLEAYRVMDPFTASGSWFQSLTTLIEKKFFLMSRFVLFISRLNKDEFNLVLTVKSEFNLVNQVFHKHHHAVAIFSRFLSCHLFFS